MTRLLRHHDFVTFAIAAEPKIGPRGLTMIYIAKSMIENG